jgi:hypothetical protein
VTEAPFDDRDFFKAGGSGDDGCVEVAIADHTPDLIGLRDSKNPGGSVLVVAPREWVAFSRCSRRPGD